MAPRASRPRRPASCPFAPGPARRHVAGRAQDHSPTGSAGVAWGSPSAPSSSPPSPKSVTRGTQLASNPPTGGARFRGAELQQDVAGLEVTIGHAALVGVAAPPGPASGRAGRPRAGQRLKMLPASGSQVMRDSWLASLGPPPRRGAARAGATWNWSTACGPASRRGPRSTSPLPGAGRRPRQGSHAAGRRAAYRGDGRPGPTRSVTFLPASIRTKSRR